jgi:hypothetical protein
MRCRGASLSLGSVGSRAVECGIVEHAAHHCVSRPQHLPSVLPREVRGHRLREGEHCERTRRGSGERDAGQGDIDRAGMATIWLAIAAMAGLQRGGAAYSNRQMGRRRSDTDHDAAVRSPHPVQWGRNADLWIAGLRTPAVRLRPDERRAASRVVGCRPDPHPSAMHDGDGLAQTALGRRASSAAERSPSAPSMSCGWQRCRIAAPLPHPCTAADAPLIAVPLSGLGLRLGSGSSLHTSPTSILFMRHVHIALRALSRALAGRARR